MAILNDNYLTWDTEAHFYLPSAELIQDKLNLNLEVMLGSEVEAQLYLEDAMWFIKDYIINYGNDWNRTTSTRKIEYALALNESQERLSLKRAFVEFVRYAKNDEGDMVSLQTGLNLIAGQIVPIEELRGRKELSGRLERILKNSYMLYSGSRAWSIPSTAVYGVDY